MRAFLNSFLVWNEKCVGNIWRHVKLFTQKSLYAKHEANMFNFEGFTSSKLNLCFILDRINDVYCVLLESLEWKVPEWKLPTRNKHSSFSSEKFANIIDDKLLSHDTCEFQRKISRNTRKSMKQNSLMLLSSFIVCHQVSIKSEKINRKSLSLSMWLAAL